MNVIKHAIPKAETLMEMIAHVVLDVIRNFRIMTHVISFDMLNNENGINTNVLTDQLAV